MTTKSKLLFYLLYILSASIWLGAAFHDSLSNNITWFRNPITYIEHMKNHPIPGALNAWPISTAFVTLCTIVSFVLFIRYKGPGRANILTSITGTLFIIAVTFIYFVPTLLKIFVTTNTYNDSELTTMSKQWILLNVIRFFLLLFLFITGLRGLVKLKVKGIHTGN